jgi:hypothetical protein
MWAQGCQIFLVTMYQNEDKCTNVPTTELPNGPKMYITSVISK